MGAPFKASLPCRISGAAIIAGTCYVPGTSQHCEVGNTVPTLERRSYGQKVSDPLASGLSLREVPDQWGREDCETSKMGCLCCDFSVRRVWPGRLLGGGEVPAGAQRTGEEEEQAASRWREEHEQRWRERSPAGRKMGSVVFQAPP